MVHDLRFMAACGLAVMCCLAGCHRDGLIEVSGVVTYDGQPVKKGAITLLPSDGKGPTAAAVIENGKYVVQVASGAKRVRIEGFKVVGQQAFDPRMPNSPKADILEQILPERYNSASTLDCEIKPGNNALDFDLTSR